MKRIILCLMAAVGCLVAAAADFCGEWSGNVSVGAVSLKLVLHVDKQGTGFVCTLDSPMQGAKGIPCDATVEGDVITVEVPSIGASYKATIDAAGASIAGDFVQLGKSFPLAMKRVQQKAEAPKPYKQTEVKVDAGGGITLAGTFTLPEGKGPFPAVVLVTGSGPQDRDETIGDHKPFAIIADSLTRHGIAVLRCDDRGVGGSSLASGYETTADLAVDALAMLRALKGYAGVDSTRVGFIGHSEGGTIAIINALKGARFIITLAAPGVKGKDLLLKQNEKVAEVTGQEITADKREMLEAVFSAVETEESVTQLQRTLKMLMADMSVDARNAQIASLTSPWYRYFVKFDPTEALKAIGKQKKVAMLAINGEMDAQVDADQNLGAIKALVPKAKISRYATLNHLMQPCESIAKSLDYVGNPAEFSPEVIAEMITFIKGIKK
ncbi:MAG: alpha/beta hydrolase [Bacteroidales bacterium]|nr:alpha/beta hydrolase [Bacteroidales bacterium]